MYSTEVYCTVHTSIVYSTFCSRAVWQVTVLGRCGDPLGLNYTTGRTTLYNNALHCTVSLCIAISDTAVLATG